MSENTSPAPSDTLLSVPSSPPLETAAASPSVEPATASSTDSWRNALPDHLKDNSVLSKFHSLDKLAEGYLNSSSLIGKRVADIPMEKIKEMYSPEELGKFYTARGLPESADSYTYSSLDAETIEKDPALKSTLSELSALAYKHGISQEALNAIVEFEATKMDESSEKTRQTYVSELYNRYGKDIQTADNVATDAARQLGGDELVDLLKSSGLAHHPQVFNAFYKVGSAMKEDRVSFDGIQSSDLSNIASVRAEIDKRKHDREFYGRWSNGDNAAANEMDALYQTLDRLEKSARR